MRISAPHQMWARALDLEGFLVSLENNNADVWVMGLKLGESEGDPFVRSRGGATELLGGIFNGGAVAGHTAVETIDSDVTLLGWYARWEQHNVTVKETVNGTTRSLFCCEQFPERHWIDWKDIVETGFHLPFFRSAYGFAPFVPTPAPPPWPPVTTTTTSPAPLSPECWNQCELDCGPGMHISKNR